MRRRISILIKLLFVFLIVLAFGCTKKKADTITHDFSIDGLKVNKMVIVSRHNIRSPLSGAGSLLAEVTPHQWFNWTSQPSELSLKGGMLEEKMGVYYRNYLQGVGLYNDVDTFIGKIRIYTNAKERTIETGRHFASTFLLGHEFEIETHAEYDTMDPVFNPQLTFVSESYKKEALDEIKNLFNNEIINLQYNYDLLTKLIDFEESNAYKNGTITGFDPKDIEISLELNKEPSMTGSLKNACSISDALVLQYYENRDDYQAAFNKNIDLEYWKNISYIKDLYGDILFTAPLISHNVANPLLKEIKKELNNDNYFSFLCGHDSNIGSVLSSLNVKPYELNNAIEAKTPIGCKITIVSYTDNDNNEYYGIYLVYQSIDELRNVTDLTYNNPPMIVKLEFKDINCNDNGLYKKEDFLDLLDDNINEYDNIISKYSDNN